MLRKDIYILKNHFNIEFAVKNFQKIVHILQIKASKMAVFTNGGVLAGLKIIIFEVLLYHFLAKFLFLGRQKAG